MRLQATKVELYDKFGYEMFAATDRVNSSHKRAIFIITSGDTAARADRLRAAKARALV